MKLKYVMKLRSYMKWKSFPYWLKGGIISIWLLVLSMIILVPFGFHVERGAWFPGIYALYPILIPTYWLTSILPFYIDTRIVALFFILAIFGIGALTGYIIKLIKSKSS